MSIVQIDPLGFVPDHIKKRAADAVLGFLSQSAEKTLGDEAATLVDSLKSDAEFQSALNQGIRRGVDRFVREYSQIDQDLVLAISRDTSIWETRSLKKALLDLLRNPQNWEGGSWEPIAAQFEEALPEIVERDRVNQAIRFLVQCIAEAVWHLPELYPIYAQIFNRMTADRAERTLREMQGLRSDLRQTLLVLADAAARPPMLADPRATESIGPAVLHNLPNPDYLRFLGRERELANIRRLLAPDSRSWIVVIDGIGGIGKSALALEVAHRYLREFPELPETYRFGAIVWVSAKASFMTAEGPVSRPHVPRTLEDIYTSIALTLQREEITRARPDDQDGLVSQALVRHRTLLIVDNFESIDDDRVNAFLQELPAPTKCIVTTRHRIDVAYPIRLTGMPMGEALSLIADECEKKGVDLGEEDAELLFRRTGGVPLAIVWSIAQMGFGYGVNAVLRRLGDARGDIARYCFEGAMQRIGSKPAHDLLMALSVFATDASRQALGLVADVSELDRDDGLVELEKLSLANKAGDRFSLLPLTQEFTRAQLAQSSEKASGYRQRFVEYYDDFIRRRSLGKVPDQELIEIERENLIEAVEEVWKFGQIEKREELLNRFFIFLWRRGYWAESVHQISRLLDWSYENQQVDWQARFEHWLGRLYMFQGQLDEAERYLRLAIEHCDPSEWRWVSVQTYLAQVYLRRQKPEEAEEILMATLKEASVHEPVPGRGSALVLNALAEIRLQSGNLVEAGEYLLQALSICEGRIEHVTVLGHTYHLLAQMALASHDFPAADGWMSKYLDLAIKEGFIQEIAVARFGLAQTRNKLGKYREAQRLAEEALVLFERIGMASEVATVRRFLDHNLAT